MIQEAVVFENGNETDWIDPVISLREDESFWYVFNGHYTYHIEKSKYRELIVRELK